MNALESTLRILQEDGSMPGISFYDESLRNKIYKGEIIEKRPLTAHV